MTDVWSRTSHHIEDEELMARKRAMEKKETRWTSGSTPASKLHHKEYMKPCNNWNKGIVDHMPRRDGGWKNYDQGRQKIGDTQPDSIDNFTMRNSDGGVQHILSSI